MTIYLLHDDKIYTFELPKVASGNYILSDEINSIKQNLVSINGVDGKWIASSNNEVQIVFDGKNVDKIELIVDNFYQLVLYGRTTITFYVCPANDPGFILKSVLPETKSILIGSGSECDICFPSPHIDKNHVLIEYSNNTWSLARVSDKIPTYVNFVKAKPGYLNNFDCIFIMGLKIIVFGPYILHNYGGNSNISFTQKKFDNASLSLMVQDYNTNGMVFKDFYDEKDYFEKSPLFQDKVKENDIDIAMPPSMQKNSGNSILMEIVPTVAMSLTSILTFIYSIGQFKSGQIDRENFITNLVMCVVLIFTGVFWPFIQEGYIKLKENVVRGRTKRKYKKYIKEKQEKVESIRSKEEQTLKHHFIDLQECVLSIAKRDSHLFSRDISQDDFLSFRLGVGDKKANIHYNYQKPEFEVEKNDLYKYVDKMIEEEELVKDVPAVLSLKKYNYVAFINNNISHYEYLKSILLQAAALQSYADLKIVVLTDTIGGLELDFTKNINHCWDNAKTIRFFATNILEATDISSHLETIYNTRAEKEENYNANRDTQYLIITDKISMYRKINIIGRMLADNKNYGFKLIMFDSEINAIPSSCEYFIHYGAAEAMGFEKDMSEETMLKFKPEFASSFGKNLSLGVVMSLLANIPIKIDSEVAGTLTNNLGFLEMYGVGRVEQLNIEERWKQSDVINTLSAPVGVDANGELINLDLHEKRHGPHGLIAGMTGSGKSEFIITYILSLAINYNPEEVQFVLIDYKGGGLAGAFENKKTGVKLPHLVGTITNLDIASMHRTLVSIQSELQRRQKKFNEVKESLNTGTIDIYKYQKLYREGKIDEPMSHLFIISDEFAELKAQQPDFMDNLVSAARIGRSLGIHLILATQKPSGVVDEQIWSNSKFKVCCKVQTAEDSTEMLGKPDAAYLKDSGRFYLQVGYDIYYILGQSAYSGRNYEPSDKLISKVDNTISFVNNTGEAIKTIDSEETEVVVSTADYGEELSNVINHVINISNGHNFKIRKLWLDDIPSQIYVSDLKNKYNNVVKNERFIINPIMGEYDDPANQSQGVVTLPITTRGNCVIAGTSGSGKSTFLSTFIYSTIISHSTEEVNFYILDFGRENLKKFQKAPQVADVLTADDKDKVNILFNRIRHEIQVRKKILSEQDLDFLSYNLKGNFAPLPNIIIVINGFDAFADQFQDFVDEHYLSLIRECTKFGIYFLVAETSPNAMMSTFLDQFNQKIAFKFNDESAYQDFVGAKNPPKDEPGRGIIIIDEKDYQFQTALITTEENSTAYLNSVFEQLNNQLTKAEPIPLMPSVINAESFINEPVTLNRVPIGYDMFTIEKAYFDFSSYINVILSSKQKRLSSFINQLTDVTCRIPNNKVIVIDGTQKYSVLRNKENIKYYDGNFAKLNEYLLQNIGKSNDSLMIYVFGYENIRNHLKEYMEKEENADKAIVTLEELIFKASSSGTYRFVICGTYSSQSNFENESWFSLMPNKTGIAIYESFYDQEFLLGKRMDEEYNLQLDYNNAFVVKNMEKTVINYMSD